MARMEINTVILDEATLAEMAENLADGKIDVAAINAGREVIIAAPSVWAGVRPEGYTYSYRAAQQRDPQDILMAENDTFRAGMELPFVQLW
jgi:hypothetical protein